MIDVIKVVAVVMALASLLVPYAVLVTVLSKDVTTIVRKVINLGERLLIDIETRSPSNATLGGDIEAEINATIERYMQSLETLISSSNATLTSLCDAGNYTSCGTASTTVRSVEDYIKELEVKFK